MSERLYSRPCSLCGCGLSITLDTMTEDITIRPDNLPSLAKDKMEIITAYRRLKGLGPEWVKAHQSRAMVYADELLKSVGFEGGQLDRAIALLGWLKDSGKDFDLSTAPTHYKAFQAHLEAVTVKMKGRCSVCGESYTKGFMDDADNCGRH